MYAASPAFSSGPFAGRAAVASNAYARVGVETSVEGADPHRLVALLFDGLLESVAQARGAIRERRVEAKVRAIARALRIVEEGLRAGLNLREGGSLARDLDALYTYLAQRLALANLHNDDAMLDECARLVEPLRSAWAAIAPGREAAA